MARILVIEDNPANLELMSYLLSVNGHDIVTATDGEEGLKLASSSPPVDLIICDVHLPVVDGYEVARRLKTDAELRSIPLVAVTALAMVGDKEKVLETGFDSYIPKPINPREFAAQVQSFLPDRKAGAPPFRPIPAVTITPAVQKTSAARAVRILVVDNTPANRELARATLEPHGYRITAVASVNEARARLEAEQFDLILSDLHMPGDSGLQLLEMVRDDPRWQGMPFVLTSSSVWGECDRERSRVLKVDSFVIRPVSPQKILDAVTSSLSKAKETERGNHPGC